MKRTAVLKFAIISCLISLGACGGSSNANESTTSLNATSPTTTIAQVTDTTLNGNVGITVEAAAQQYSSIVRKTNCAIMSYQDLEKQYSLGNGQVDLENGLPDLTSAMLKTATERDLAVRALVSKDWPQKVQSDVAALALFWASAQRAEKAVSESTDVGSWNSSLKLYLSLLSSPNGGLSKIVRIKLNLPDFNISEC